MLSGGSFFAGDLCDIFDHLCDKDVRTRMWELFRQTPHLTWLILTKRPQHISEFLPADWGRDTATCGLA